MYKDGWSFNLLNENWNDEHFGEHVCILMKWQRIRAWKNYELCYIFWHSYALLSLSLSSPIPPTLSITSSLSFSQGLSPVVKAYKTFMHARSHLRVQAKDDHTNTILSDEKPKPQNRGMYRNVQKLGRICASSKWMAFVIWLLLHCGSLVLSVDPALDGEIGQHSCSGVYV